MAVMRIDVYADVVCPWCYIGKRRLERALASFAGGAEAEVTFRPFQLDPDAPTTARPLAGYLERRFGAAAGAMQSRVSQVAAGEGITIAWDRALSVNTLSAHRLLWLAEREYGRNVQRALVERLFAAHFSEGGDVSDAAQLAALAVSVGMDAERVSSYLGSREGEAEVRGAIAEARALGVQAVPAFVFDDRFVLEGAQPVEMFLHALEEVRAAATTVAEDRS